MTNRCPPVGRSNVCVRWEAAACCAEEAERLCLGGADWRRPVHLRTSAAREEESRRVAAGRRPR